MQKFNKKVFLITLAAISLANISYAEEKSDKENEVIILGNYQNFFNITKSYNKKSGILIPKDSNNEDGSDTNDNDNTIPEPVNPVEPIEPVKLVVVKENGNDRAWKSKYGEKLSDINNGIIDSLDVTALWMIDENTIVTNNSNLSSVYSTENDNLNQYTVHVLDKASFINNGIIAGQNVIGVNLENADTFVNGNNGNIKNVGDYGVKAVDTKEIKNSGLVQNVGNYGIYAVNVAGLKNESTGKIVND